MRIVTPQQLQHVRLVQTSHRRPTSTTVAPGTGAAVLVFAESPRSIVGFNGPFNYFRFLSNEFRHVIF